jgi:hypothetical protein
VRQFRQTWELARTTRHGATKDCAHFLPFV